MKILVALISLSLSAFATSTNFDTGKFVSGTLTGSFSTSLNASITGSLAEIDLVTGKLVQTTEGCPMGDMCFDFSSGSVKIIQGGKTVFEDTLAGGITLKSGDAGSISGTLTDTNGIRSGSADASFVFSGKKITSGSEDVAFRSGTVPEISSLVLLGSGMCGLWWFGRTRLMQTKAR